MNYSEEIKGSHENLVPLKKYTILALSNLLRANIEMGLKYSLAMVCFSSLIFC